MNKSDYDAGQMNLVVDGCSIGSSRSPLRAYGCVKPEQMPLNALHGEETPYLNLVKQCDRSTLSAIMLTESYIDCLRQRGLSSDDIGIFVSSCLGGIEFSELQLERMIRLGSKKVSPYQVIAWFYAATQGQVTITHGVTGYAKSFAGSGVASVQALSAAAGSLMYGDCQCALITSVEKCETPYYSYLLACGNKYHNPSNSALIEYRNHCGAALLRLADRSTEFNDKNKPDLLYIRGLWRVHHNTELSSALYHYRQEVGDQATVFGCQEVSNMLSSFLLELKNPRDLLSGELFEFLARAYELALSNDGMEKEQHFLKVFECEPGERYLIAIRGGRI